MILKKKITISITAELLKKIDSKIDKINFKNRSNVIESFVLDGLSKKGDIGAIIIANEKKWDSGKYPLNIPKFLIKIDGKTLIERHLENLQKTDIKKCIIAIGHKGKMIKDVLKDKNYGIDITFINFNIDDESGIIINKCSDVLDTKNILVILGDNYFNDLNISDFIDYHNIHNQGLTIIVKTIEATQGYGNIKLEGNNIVKFVEKPKIKEDISFIKNAGIYLMNSDIIPIDDTNFKIERDFFPDYVKKHTTKAYFYNGNYSHMQNDDTYNKYSFIDNKK